MRARDFYHSWVNDRLEPATQQYLAPLAELHAGLVKQFEPLAEQRTGWWPRIPLAWWYKFKRFCKDWWMAEQVMNHVQLTGQVPEEIFKTEPKDRVVSGFNAGRCQACGKPGSTICPYCTLNGTEK